MIYHFKFTIEEIKALARLLEHQYISYEDIEVIEVTRKIMRIVQAHELASGDNGPT